MASSTTAPVDEPLAEDPLAEKCGVWTVHSETDARPGLRGFAKSEADAQALLEQLRAQDPDADKTEYWLLELSRGELEDFRQFGMLPPGY